MSAREDSSPVLEGSYEYASCVIFASVKMVIWVLLPGVLGLMAAHPGTSEFSLMIVRAVEKCVYLLSVF
jgi:Na+/H+-dicarboxylate symporter